ncbi:MAG: insulinase family protein [Erysipelotrichaceae bacterium]
MKTTRLQEGVQLHIIESKKYKDVSIYFNYYQKTNAKNRVTRSLLGQIMSDKCEAYPTKSKMAEQKDKLYGASIYTSNFTYGTGNIFQVSCKVLNDLYCKKGVLENSLNLLKNVIEHPIIQLSELDEAKRNLKDSAYRKMDKPALFASSRAFSIYGENTYLAYSSILNPESIEEVTLDEIIKEHHAITMDNPLDIYVFGNVDKDEIISLINQIFCFNSHDKLNHVKEEIADKPAVKVIEHKQSDQCSLIMFFKTYVDIDSDDYYVLKAANTLFGAVPASFLFQEVREKNSLCYSISSTISGQEQLLIIKTGIDHANDEKVIALVHEQLDKMKQGHFEMDDFYAALQLYNNVLKGSKDDIVSSLNFEYTSMLTSSNVGIDETIKKMSAVSKEDIMRVFSQLELKLTYILKKEDSSNE